ncbi:hypothetical protein MKL09_04630 [Methylobacterium sp. J-048]|uniref:hypothetical protein n=1 Tax=Methylobacterium sp. J-048 TaxID=2836635 RepID=UPI001FBAA0A5|nr:hypothetical protein [Methylobacterium sp. J-048]MCJ2055833.1 hypothetical protein [Methylobacterium sp. J-048]
MPETTFNLPEGLVDEAEAYAARHGTSVTAIVRAHLEAVIGAGPAKKIPDPLVDFAAGMITRREAIEALGLRDYAALLVVLGDHGLTPPRPPEHLVQEQAAAFERLWTST